ncbi:staphylopine biosynthesis dehydrogenase [Staphylococcus schleiferi]|uniref:staphylopine biosynthesis dehydrogenase n=1 Tax=Staphylococcus schleiferi TaxID=1295 RepID=UPI002481117E|nr:staphylopine biosynthesis dehydrogenase [Staphylococcus schleiferi]
MSKSVLIAGTGPVAIQLAVLFDQYSDNQIAMASRSLQSEKSRKFIEAYQQTQKVEVSVQNEAHQQLAGEATLANVYESYHDIQKQYDVLVLACTADAYSEVLSQISERVLTQLKSVVLISPTFGSHMIVKQQLQAYQPNIEVISFSTYLGDTGVTDVDQPHRVITKGLKKRLYIGSTQSNTQTFQEMVALMTQIGVPVTVVEHPLQAESRNSSLYVHPALFMNMHALKAVFQGTDVPFFVYKLFPEGPITMKCITEMRLMWQEVMHILQKMNIETLNLLKFMVKENYPLREETIDASKIEAFETLSPVEQEYLLYVRYTGILIDPFSKPDAACKYFDFSAVPFKHVFQNGSGEWQIPRMPSEDYYRTQIMRGIARVLKINTPMMDTFMYRYEAQLEAFQANHPNDSFSAQFKVQDFAHDIACIESQLSPH